MINQSSKFNVITSTNSLKFGLQFRKTDIESQKIDGSSF